jgi:beta-galactosidase
MFTRRGFVGRATAVATAAGLHLPVWARAFPPPDGAVRGSAAEAANARPLLLGADYYPDQTPEKLWEEDARWIAEAGLTNVRVAEFAWGLLEPSEGKFDFAWLERSVAILYRHGIAVILGTPSAAPPPWLSSKYPEILLVNKDGATVAPGGRRFTCPTNRTYRRLSLRIATEMAKTFANAPGVVGWQIDNEYTLQPHARCYCKFCREGFQDWLETKYGSLEAVNEKWGTVFWSQTYTDWRQIPVPLPSNGDPNPGLVLDYDRYQSHACAASAEEQLAMLRRVCPQHFVTTNQVGAPLDTLNLREMYRNMDFVSSDNYPGFAQVFMPALASPEAMATMIGLGHDSMRCVKGGKPFLIMEEQAGKAGQSFFAPQPHPGQLRLWAFQAVAHGAMGVNYFRWDSARFGAEEYWFGMLNHDRSKSIGFDEMVQTVKELKSLGREALEAAYVAETAVSFDHDSSWALAVQPGNSKLSYMAQLMAWYGAVASANTGTDLIHLDEDLANYRAVFAPVQYVVSEKQAENIRRYVRGGGTFVAGFRLGVKDESSRIVNAPLPGLLRDVMGVTVRDPVPVYTEKIAVRFGPQLAGADAQCALWADLLKPESATAIATYAGAYEGDAAITINSFGKGKAVYVCADLEPMSLARVLRTVVAMSGSKSRIEAPRGVELTRRRAGGKEWVFVLNHTPDEQKVNLAGNFGALVGTGPSNQMLTLRAYDLAVLQRG